MEKDVGLAIVVERMRAASVASAHSPLGTPGRMTGRTPAGTAALGRHFFPVEDIVVPTPVAAPAAAPGASDVAASSGVVASSGAAPSRAAVAFSVPAGSKVAPAAAAAASPDVLAECEMLCGEGEGERVASGAGVPVHVVTSATAPSSVPLAGGAAASATPTATGDDVLTFDSSSSSPAALRIRGESCVFVWRVALWFVRGFGWLQSLCVCPDGVFKRGVG